MQNDPQKFLLLRVRIAKIGQIMNCEITTCHVLTLCILRGCLISFLIYELFGFRFSSLSIGVAELKSYQTGQQEDYRFHLIIIKLKNNSSHLGAKINRYYRYANK